VTPGSVEPIARRLPKEKRKLGSFPIFLFFILLDWIITIL
jgi:hypothetical protein